MCPKYNLTRCNNIDLMKTAAVIAVFIIVILDMQALGKEAISC